MKLKATLVSSLVTGGWTAFGIVSMTIFLKKDEISLFLYNAVFLLALIIFFFIPFLFLVIGRENLKFGISYGLSRDYWERFPNIIIRMFCWFIGASIFGILFRLLLPESE